MAYGQALDLQRDLNQQVIDSASAPTILLVEHEPVITLTRRPAVRQHLIASDKQLADLGVATHETDRGGDITYHGPGQLVVYPILKLADFNLNLSSYMRLLEQAVIDTLATYGITGHRECGNTGVWVDPDVLAPSPSQAQGRGEGGACDAQQLSTNNNTAKICAMGVRIRKNTTLHGLALNVHPDLSHFNLIIPCGLHNRPVTSMQQRLGDNCPDMTQVKKTLVSNLTTLLTKNTAKTT